MEKTQKKVEWLSWADLNEEDKEIVSFIQKNGTVRWTDLENEFTRTRKWSKGKFVNHWLHVKPLVDRTKYQKTGRKGYKIKATFNNAADKAVLKSEVDKGELNEIQIPLERFEKVAEFITSKSFDILKEAVEKASNGMKVAEREIDGVKESPEGLGNSTTVEATEKKVFKAIAEKRKQLFAERKKRSLISKIKELLKPTDLSEAQIELSSLLIPIFFEKNLVEQRKKADLMQIFKDVKIQIVCSPGEAVPLLTDEDITSIVNIVVPKIIDENKGKIREKPFRLIVSFPDNPK